MWLAVAMPDFQTAQIAVHDHWAQDLTPEQRAAADGVVDLDSDEPLCPACGAAFRPADGRCPGCGLRLG